jgi:hypothetical protein
MNDQKGWQTYTMSTAGLLFVIGSIVMGLIDLCFVLFGGTGSSISNFLVNTGYASPLFCFGVGVVCGHIFGRMTPLTDNNIKIEQQKGETNV